MRRRQPSVLVLGAGSAGNRHARNLDSAGAKVSVADPCADRTRATRVAERRVRGSCSSTRASSTVHSGIR